MKGWQIFVHSVRQVFGNLGAALRVSGLLYLAQLVLGLALGVSLYASEADMEAAMAAGTFPWLPFLIVVIVAVIAALWIAVSWHRYVLLVEEPGLLPRFHGDRIGAYFLKGLLIGVILIVPFIVASLIGGLIGGPAMSGPEPSLVAMLVLFICLLPVVVIGLRLSTILPGVALGAPSELGLAWGKTQGQAGTFVFLALLWWAVSFVVAFVAGVLGGALPALGILWEFLAGWVVMMVGISILTTLYGHYVEGRALI